MKKLKDAVHDCDCCEYYPCSCQDVVSDSGICEECPISCCRHVLVVLAPCEEGVLESGDGLLRMKKDGWCWYYDKDSRKCNVYDHRPVVCMIASCRFIREGEVRLI